MDIGKQVADSCIRRAQSLGTRGKARDKAALEFFCGAAAAHAADSPEYNRLATLAWIISLRGYSEVVRISVVADLEEKTNVE